MRSLHAALRAAFALLVLLSAAPAAATGCPEHFASRSEPVLVDPRLTARARELCFRAYAVLHSGATRTPLWSAERLTTERVEVARGVERTNLFHAEERPPPDELADHARYGHDRGHMAPSADMPDEGSQVQGFSLANMISQARKPNADLWSAIETGTPGLAPTELWPPLR